MNFNQFKQKIEELVALKEIMIGSNFNKTKEYAANFLVKEKEKQFGYSEKERQFICGIKLKDFENALKTELETKGYECNIEIGDYFPMEMNAYLTITKQNDNDRKSFVYNYDISFNGTVYNELLCKYDFVLPLENLTVSEHPDWVNLIKDFPEVKKIMWNLIKEKNNKIKQSRITLIQRKIDQNILKQQQLVNPEYIQGEISHLIKENKILEDKKEELSCQLDDGNLDEIAKEANRTEDF